MTLLGRFQNRRATAAQATIDNQVLRDGEMGLETDTDKFKFGDGATSWNSRGYAASGALDWINILNWAGADRTGTTDMAPTIRAAFAQAQALAQPGYNHSRSAVVHLPAGRYLIGSKCPIPDGVALIGEGWGATSLYVPLAFPDNCVFEPVGIDNSQEFIGLQGFSLYGQQGDGQVPTSTQANAGAATTVATAIPAVPVNGFDLQAAGSLASWPTNGTLLCGTHRVIYQSIDLPSNTFKMCYSLNGYSTAAINIGDAVTPVATNNVSGVHCIGVAGPSYMRDLWVDSFTAECVVQAYTNAVDCNNIVANHSNRDCYLHIATRASNYFRAMAGQYSGMSLDGNTYAGLHVMGTTMGSPPFGGNVTIDGLYSEQSKDNQVALWLDNVGSVSGDNINLQGGNDDTGTAFASQRAVLITSTQASPLTQDGAHAANISLSNLHCAKVGRILLDDQVRGRTSAVNNTNLGRSLTRYDTEHLVVGPVVPGSVTPKIYSGTGSPETVISSNVGSLYLRSDGGAGTSVYVKETGAGNTGWIGK